MKLNPDKCHLLVCGYKHECFLANIGGASVIESYEENFLGISIDRDLTFENHVNMRSLGNVKYFPFISVRLW